MLNHPQQEHKLSYLLWSQVVRYFCYCFICETEQWQAMAKNGPGTAESQEFSLIFLHRAGTPLKVPSSGILPFPNSLNLCFAFFSQELCKWCFSLNLISCSLEIENSIEDRSQGPRSPCLHVGWQRPFHNSSFDCFFSLPGTGGYQHTKECVIH